MITNITSPFMVSQYCQKSECSFIGRILKYSGQISMKKPSMSSLMFLKQIFFSFNAKKKCLQKETITTQNLNTASEYY